MYYAYDISAGLKKELIEKVGINDLNASYD